MLISRNCYVPKTKSRPTLPDPADWPCDHEVFCAPGEHTILHEVQKAKIYKDSKTFVDMPMKFKRDKVLENFKNLTDYGFATLLKFVDDNFDKEGHELESFTPVDWIENPEFVETIKDENFKKLALKMNSIWKNLTRVITKSRSEIEQKSSLIYLDHPFVVPGGRWDFQSILLFNLQGSVKFTTGTLTGPSRVFCCRKCLTLQGIFHTQTS